MKTSNIIVVVVSILLIIGAFYLGFNKEKEEGVVDNNSLNTQTQETTQIQEEETSIINNNNQTKEMKATFKTNKGNFTIELFPNLAPKTVDNFVKLSGDGFYNNTKFHRVIEGFMNQGGDPLSKEDSQKNFWGTGGPGYQFEDEIHAENKNVTGTISMANAGPNTNGSQFFINVADNSFLDTKHTVFGKVVDGLDVVLSINKVATDGTDKPLDAVIINSIEIASN